MYVGTLFADENSKTVRNPVGICNTHTRHVSKTMHLAEWLTALPFTFFIPQLRILPTSPVTHFT